MSVYNFCYSYFSQLQYCTINKNVKVFFLMNLIMKSKESKVINKNIYIHKKIFHNVKLFRSMWAPGHCCPESRK